MSYLSIILNVLVHLMAPASPKLLVSGFHCFCVRSTEIVFVSATFKKANLVNMRARAYAQYFDAYGEWVSIVNASSQPDDKWAAHGI